MSIVEAIGQGGSLTCGGEKGDRSDVRRGWRGDRGSLSRLIANCGIFGGLTEFSLIEHGELIVGLRSSFWHLCR